MCASTSPKRAIPRMTDIPQASAESPSSIRDGVALAAAAWVVDPSRPHPVAHTIAAWKALLATWAEAPDMPLLVRKARGNRGHALRHEATGRTLVPTDNSPAHWSMALALTGICPTLGEVRAMLGADSIPVAMVIKTTEKAGATYRCTRHTTPGP